MAAYPQAIVEAYRAGLRARRVQSFPDWADENIVIRRQGKRVRWRTSLTPYLREPMMKLSADDPTEELVIMKPSQWGASEMFNAFCAYVIVNRATPILFLQPDIDAARRYSLERIGPVFEDCQALRGILVEPKSRDPGNTLHSKAFWGGTFDLLGGNSPAGVASKPAGVVLIDEWDRMSASAGVGDRAEGDQYELAKNRTITFTRWRKIVAASTPGNTSTSKVEPAYLASDRRKFFLPCPLCSRQILLDFDRLWWPRGNVARVVYRCQLCDSAFDERPKQEMLAAGVWVAEQPTRSVPGYWSNGLYSPWLKWREIADRWERAEGRPGKVRVFFNNILAKTYDVHAETRVQAHELAPLRYETKRNEDGEVIVPRGVAVLTAGADVQHNRIEVVVFGWGRGEECWHIDQAVIPGDPSGHKVWDDLDAYLKREWETEDGECKMLSASCIDTGYEANRVYEFVRTRAARGVWGVKGARGGEGRRIWPKRPSRSSYQRVEFYLVGVDTAKAHIYARLKASVARKDEVTSARGMVHVADHIGDDGYLEQLASEVPVTKTIHGHPRVVWELPEHKRNEALDCAVYGYAALHGLKAKGRRVESMLGKSETSSPMFRRRVSAQPSKVRTWEETPPDQVSAANSEAPRQQNGRRIRASRGPRKVVAGWMDPG